MTRGLLSDSRGVVLANRDIIEFTSAVQRTRVRAPSRQIRNCFSVLSAPYKFGTTTIKREIGYLYRIQIICRNFWNDISPGKWF